MNAIRILSNKCRLAAGVDACRTHTNGEMGKEMRKFIINRIEKIQLP